ncbi:unnamed protein product, partial [Polarella glacialis]
PSISRLNWDGVAWKLCVCSMAPSSSSAPASAVKRSVAQRNRDRQRARWFYRGLACILGAPGLSKTATEGRTSEADGKAEKKQEDKEKAIAEDNNNNDNNNNNNNKLPDTELQTMREVQKIPAATEVVYGKTLGTGSTIANPNCEQAATPSGDLRQVDVEAALPPGTVKAAVTEPKHQQQRQQQQQQDIEPAPINVINEKVKIRKNKAAAGTSDAGGYEAVEEFRILSGR